MKNPFLLSDISFASCMSHKRWLISGVPERFTKRGCVLRCSVLACIALSHPSSCTSWMLNLHTLNPSAAAHLQQRLHSFLNRGFHFPPSDGRQVPATGFLCA